LEKSDIVKLLWEDVTEFNRRRQEDPDMGPGLDLTGAQLTGASLVKADLGRVNLSGADLRDVDLTEAILNNTVLEDSDLGNANLAGANLHRFRIRGADMRGAQTEVFGGNCRMCLHTSNFQDVRWDKEQIEAMLRVINLNSDWQVRYEVVPK
jgi:hypothetical protein